MIMLLWLDSCDSEWSRAYTDPDFARANRDDPELLDAVARLPVHSRITVGGGAAPAVTIGRVAPYQESITQ